MGRTYFFLVGILLALVGMIDTARGQAHPAHPHQMTFGEALNTFNNLANMPAPVYFSAQGTDHGHPWSMALIKVSFGGWTSQAPYLFVPAYPNPLAYEPEAPPSAYGASLAVARPSWLKPDNTPQPPLPVLPKRRNVSASVKAKAEESLSKGDASFSKQNYGAAIDRYRAAITLAPDWADPYFRQGFALVAMGNYRGAMTAFRAGLRLRAEWKDSSFRLDAIYGDGAFDRANQKLAQRLTRDPLNPDLLLAMGMQLYFNGQQQRSAIYLSQVADLQAVDRRLLDAFLTPLNSP